MGHQLMIQQLRKHAAVEPGGVVEGDEQVWLLSWELVVVFCVQVVDGGGIVVAVVGW